MDITTATICLGITAAFTFGLSKTGFPGISILGVVIMAIALQGAEKKMPGVVLPLLLIGDVIAVAYYQKHTDWKTLFRLFPVVAVGMTIGILLMGSVDNQQFQVILGTMVLGLVGLDIARKWYGWEKFPHSWWFAAMMGATAGFATYIGNAAGPVMAVYLLAIGMTKEKFMGCAAWFFFIVNMTKVPFYTWQGSITAETLRFDLIIVVGMIVGALVGRPLLKVTPEKVFGPIVLGLAALGALYLVGAFRFIG